MIKVRADLFEHVTSLKQRSARVTVLLPMSPYLKKDGSAVMGAGTLRIFAERFPYAPRLIGANIPACSPVGGTARELAYASGEITLPANIDGVPVCAWLIQPRMGYRDYVYPHQAQVFEMSPTSDELDDPDVPGWACMPWESAIRASVPRIRELCESAQSQVVIPYPNLGDGMTNDTFNTIMGALPDNVTLLTRGAERRDGAR